MIGWLLSQTVEDMNYSDSYNCVLDIFNYQCFGERTFLGKHREGWLKMHRLIQGSNSKYWNSFYVYTNSFCVGLCNIFFKLFWNLFLSKGLKQNSGILALDIERIILPLKEHNLKLCHYRYSSKVHDLFR